MDTKRVVRPPNTCTHKPPAGAEKMYPGLYWLESKRTVWISVVSLFGRLPWGFMALLAMEYKVEPGDVSEAAGRVAVDFLIKTYPDRFPPTMEALVCEVCEHLASQE